MSTKQVNKPTSSRTVEWVEGGASGLNMVHKKGSRTLEQAVSMMRGDSEQFLMAKAPSHVFRGVLPTRRTPSEAADLTAKACCKCRHSFVQQRLRETIDPAVFINDHDGPQYAGNAKELCKDLREAGAYIRDRCKNISNLKEMRSLFDSIITEIASGRLQPYYGQNMSDLDKKIKGMRSYLENLPNLINKDDSALDTSEGINKSTFYQACCGASSIVHREDGGLDSGNLVVNAEGEEEHFSKLWMIINPLDNQKFIDGICDVLDKQRKQEQRDGKEWLEGCPLPVDHKKLLVRPSFCEKLGVTFQIFGQKAGDLVYVAPNVFHQVINLDVNLAEAVNIGSPVWQAGNAGFSVCRCDAGREKRGISSIMSNSTVVTTAKSHKVPLYECSSNYCTAQFRTKSEWEMHEKTPHRRAVAGKTCEGLYNSKTDVVYCAECNKSFCSKKNLRSHLNRCHNSEGPKRQECGECHKMYLTSNMAKHIRSHERNRTVDGVLRCEACQGTFKTPQGLGSHRRVCKK